MFWSKMTNQGKRPAFVEKMRINLESYRELILDKTMLLWSIKHIGRQHWMLQQDSAPAYKAKGLRVDVELTSLTCLRSKIVPKLNHSQSPWLLCLKRFRDKSCSKSHNSWVALKNLPKHTWSEIPAEALEKMAATCQPRLETHQAIWRPSAIIS